MNLYYISDGKNQEGPFSKEELVGKNITRTTLVWREGFQKWLPITNVSELIFLVEKMPPPLPTSAIPPPALPESMETTNTAVHHHEEDTDRPDSITYAIMLFIISTGFSLLFTFINKNELTMYYNFLNYGSGSLMYNMSLWGSTILWIIYIILIANRQNWARIVYLVFFIIGLLFIPLAWKVTIIDIPGKSVSIICGIINFIALVLLFTPSSNRWFNRR